MDEVTRLKMLQRPLGKVDVVIDTDTFNEIDDQYALAYLIRSGEKLSLKAIYAAPFFNGKVQSAEEGMRLSYEEIHRVLSLLNRTDFSSYRGSRQFLPDEHTPVISDAARDLSVRAMDYTPEKPLYVIAVAALTNIASAILLNPEIAERMVVIWLGGNAFDWPDNREFNCRQDVAAVRVVLDHAPVILLPCKGVVSAFATTKPELEYWLKGKNALCDYFYEITCKYAVDRKKGPCWSKPLWDVCAVAWLKGDRFMKDRLEPAPIAEYDHRWAFDRTRPLIRYVYHIERDELMEDLFCKLAGE